MKKLAFISLTLALALAVTGCFAESIFGRLDNETEEKATLRAPSYGAMANISEDQVEESAEGGTIVTYRQVEASGYYSFGAYLGDLGFAVTGEERQDSRVAYEVSDGTVSFVMVYDQGARTMQLVYPRGTEYETGLFPGYSRISTEEEIYVPGLGRFTFHPFNLNNPAVVAPYFYYLNSDKRKEVTGAYGKTTYSWMPFSYTNTSNNTQGNNYSGSTLFSARLVYHNADSDYEYDALNYGNCDVENRRIAYSDGLTKRSRETLVFCYRGCAPLESMDAAFSFELPESLRNSADGTIAILLDFRTGEKCALYLRENGRDLSLAAPVKSK